MSKLKKVQIPSDMMEVMQIEIINGVKKEKSSITMTPTISKFWDKLEEEINEMPKGAILDIRPEIPG